MARFPKVGDALGAYRLVRELASGPRGTTFEAFDPRLGRRVALKVLAADLATDPAFRDRFFAEAAQLARLNSLHVAQLYDHGEQDGLLYLVAQLVPDGDFGAVVTSAGRLSPAVAVSVVGQLCEAVQDARAAGLPVRPVHPSDVLVRDRGTVLYAYLDAFGVASTSAGDLEATTLSLGRLLWFALSGSLPQGAVARIEQESAAAERLQGLALRAVESPGAVGFADPAELAAALVALGTLPDRLTLGSPVEPFETPAVPVVEPVEMRAVPVLEPVEMRAVPVLEPVEMRAVPVVEPVETAARPLFADEIHPGAPDPGPTLTPEQPPVLRRGARRAGRRAAPKPAREARRPRTERVPPAERRPRRTRTRSPRAARPSVDRVARPPRDLSWLLPGGLLLVLPVLLLMGVFILVNGQGGSNFARGVTTPPQAVQEGQAFTVGAFTAEPGWQVVGTSSLWQVLDLTVRNVSSQPDDAHFTLTFLRGEDALVSLDCRTAELQTGQEQLVSCDDLTSSPYVADWDAITVQEAF